MPADVNLVTVAQGLPHDFLAVDVNTVGAAQVLDEYRPLGADNDAGVALADAPVLDANIGFR